MGKAKPFERWKYEEVQLTFGIQRAQTLPALTDWLNADGVADDYETRTIKRYYSELVRKVDAWNEDELKFFFLANLITLVNFAKPSVYSSFSQRTISAERLDVRQNKVELRGRVEFLVALGEQIPRHPFFFLHEYKPLNKTTPSDPLGQLLIAMLATQTLNADDRPLYGAFIRGGLWQFAVLEGNQYAVSRFYDATNETELFKIFSILKQCKSYIEAWINELTD